MERSVRWNQVARLVPLAAALSVGFPVLATEPADTAGPSPSVSAEPAGDFIQVSTVASEEPADGGGYDRRATATRLLDGSVLLMSYASAQLWDPLSGSLTPAGDLIAPRSESFTTTLLPDGSVLVIGGNGPVADLSSAELWDPDTRTFASAGDLSQGRDMHTAVALADGRVLVIGGENDTGWLRPAELWDLDSRAFRRAGSLSRHFNVSGSPLPAALLTDGQVMVTGGYQRDGRTYRPSVAVWDPVTMTATPVSAPRGTRAGPAIPTPAIPIPLDDGRVLIVGTGRAIGCSSEPCNGESALFVYDAHGAGPAATWTPILSTRQRASATRLSDGRVLLAWDGFRCERGGSSGFSGPPLPCDPQQASVAVWDPVGDQRCPVCGFTPIGTFPGYRVGDATLLADGHVLMPAAGGWWVVDPEARTVLPAAPPPSDIADDATIVPLLDGRALLLDTSGAVVLWTPALTSS